VLHRACALLACSLPASISLLRRLFDADRFPPFLVRFEIRICHRTLLARPMASSNSHRHSLVVRGCVALGGASRDASYRQHADSCVSPANVGSAVPCVGFGSACLSSRATLAVSLVSLNPDGPHLLTGPPAAIAGRDRSKASMSIGQRDRQNRRLQFHRRVCVSGFTSATHWFIRTGVAA